MNNYNPHIFKINIDGSCLKNPGGPGGIAGILESPINLNQELEPIFKIGYCATTNNRMELRACIEAFEWIRKNEKKLNIKPLMIITDCDYLNKYKNHVQHWNRDGWENKKSRRPIKNKDLWKKLYSLRRSIGFYVEIKREDRRSTQALKDADNLAKYYAKHHSTKTDYGFIPVKVARSSTIKRKSSSLFYAQNQKQAIKPYKKEYAKKEEYIVFFDLYSKKEGFTEKGRAYAIAKIKKELHINHLYKVQFNNNPERPSIIKIIKELDFPKK